MSLVELEIILNIEKMVIVDPSFISIISLDHHHLNFLSPSAYSLLITVLLQHRGPAGLCVMCLLFLEAGRARPQLCFYPCNYVHLGKFIELL